MKLSIIIVNYNVTQLLDECLSSIDHYISGLNFEVLVVDNASPDISWKSLKSKYPHFQFIENEINEGFAVANNKAARMASGEYLLLLNPDTLLEGDYMEELIHFADAKSDFGALGVRMHDVSGRFLPESKRSVPDLVNSFSKLFTMQAKQDGKKTYYRNDVGECDVAEVEVLTGAFLLIQRLRYLEIGGLDEAYFMYGEDIDLCYTLLQKGFKNYYYGKVSILHHKGESTVIDQTYLKRFYGAMHIFLVKYYRRQSPLLYFIMSIGLKIRYAVARLKLVLN